MESNLQVKAILQLYEESKLTKIALESFSKLRDIHQEAIKSHYGFYVFDNEMLSDLWGPFSFHIGCYNRKECIFNKRFVFPIFDFKNNLKGLVGYSDGSFEDTRSKLIKYLFPTETFLPKSKFIYATVDEMKKSYEDGYIFLVDGIMDKIRLKYLGYNSACFFGSNITKYHLKYIEPIKHKIVLRDNDDAGLSMYNFLKNNLTGVTKIDQGDNHDIDDYLKTEKNQKKFDLAFQNLKNFNYKTSPVLY